MDRHEGALSGANTPANIIQFPGPAPKPGRRCLLTISIYAEDPFEIFSSEAYREMLANMRAGDTLEVGGDTPTGPVSLSVDCLEEAR